MRFVPVDHRCCGVLPVVGQRFATDCRNPVVRDTPTCLQTEFRDLPLA
jgi:hypothetical protein